jgi:hypothetical protein
MTFRELIHNHAGNLAFIVGNGINRFQENPDSISWDQLLLRLWRKFAPNVFESVPKGITITEFYDLLDLANQENEALPYEIQKEAARLLSGALWREHHRSFMRKARELNTPVLTTNFDLILAEAADLDLYQMNKSGFTDFYPWSSYYSDRLLNDPANGFALWFINGVIKYPRSIRLGLSHYMGSVTKARGYLHSGTDANLFNGKDRHLWAGYQTWLHIIFNKDLCIFGLALDENEVFIRWLLIERAKYFRMFPERRKSGWYVAPRIEQPDDRIVGKHYFLNSIGFEIIETNYYDEIYMDAWLY